MAPVSGSPMEMVDQYIKDNKVMMFSKSTCPFCTKIKKLFEQEKIQYEVLELDQIGEFEYIMESFIQFYLFGFWSRTCRKGFLF